HRIGRQHFFRAGNRLGHAAAARTRRTEPPLHDLDALDALGTDDLDRLTVEEELDALFPAVLVVAARARHVRLVAAIHAGDGQRALTDRRAIAVHGGIAAAEHDDALALHADELLRRARQAELVIDVRD